MSKKVFLSLLVALGMGCASVQAAALPDTKELKVPGMQVTAINDLHNTFKTILFPGIEQEPAKLALMPNGEAPGVYRTFLVSLKSHLVLIDTGWGRSTPKKGITLDVLEAKGYKPEDITDILLTHLDGDHITGLTNGSQAVYPNAKLHFSKAEYDGWLVRGDARRKASIDKAKNILGQYEGRYSIFNFDEEILPGIIARDASGHTIGHTIFELGGKKGLAVVGDFLHVEPLQLRFTDLSSRYDEDKAKAAGSREYWLKKFVKSKQNIAGMHFLSIGKVVVHPEGGYAIKKIK